MLRALPFLLATSWQLAQVQAFENSLFVRPFEQQSTLSAHVPQQNLELQKTVIDIVDSGILTRTPKPNQPNVQLAQPKLVSPHTGEVPTGKSPKFTTPASKSTDEATDQDANAKAMRPSPFLKWVKPQGDAADEVATDDLDDETAKSPADDEAPQVAFRPRRPARTRPAKPLPKPIDNDSNTAVVTDQAQDEEPIEDTPLEESEPEDSASAESYPEPDEDDEPQPTTPQVDLPPLTPSQLNLRSKVRDVLTHYYSRPLNTRDRSPWELMHAMLAFEANSKVLQGGPNGEPITAVGWLCYNQACKRRTLMYVNDDDELRVRVGPALQGHRGQLMALLAQSRINKNYPMLVEGHELKIADLIEMEKRTCYPNTELTFKLIGLMHYLESDETWLNDQGMEWDIPRLIAEELRQPVRGAACGGTHRLSGLTLAYKTREARGEPVDGKWLEAKQFVTRYQQYAYRLQNNDGSFSTEWFRGPGNENSIDRKLKTTGHILEWLLYAANKQELHHWRTTKAANYLANIMHRNRYKDWEAGPLGHAIHALLVYDRLVFSPYDQPGQSPVAYRSLATRKK